MNFKTDSKLDAEAQESLEETLSFSDKYETLQLLGSGGQGQVYKVQDRVSREVYAAKRMPVDNWEDIEKLKNETRALQNLNHPSIPRYQGFHVQEDLQWKNPEYILVTEYAEGESLSKKLESGTRFTEDQLRSIKIQILDALHAAHTKGIVHRDIKPSNVILDDNYNLKVTDFGIAKFLGEKTRTRTLGAGSIEYMAPEQKKGEAIVPETDYYALGATLVALAYGQDLGVNSTPKEMLKELKHLSGPFQKSIELLLSDDPQKRKEGILEKEVKTKKTKTKVEVVKDDTVPTHQPEKSRQRRYKVEARGSWLPLVLIAGGITAYVYRQEISQTWDTWSARYDAEEKLVQTIDQNCDGLVSAEEFQTAYKTATQQEFPGIGNEKDTLICFDVDADANYVTIDKDPNLKKLSCQNDKDFRNKHELDLGKQSAEQLIKSNEGFSYYKVPQK